MKGTALLKIGYLLLIPSQFTLHFLYYFITLNGGDQIEADAHARARAHTHTHVCTDANNGVLILLGFNVRT